MFRVDFPLSRLFRFSAGLAGIALLLTMTAFVGGISTGGAKAANGKHSFRTGNVSSRNTTRRHNRRYRLHGKHHNKRRHRNSSYVLNQNGYRQNRVRKAHRRTGGRAHRQNRRYRNNDHQRFDQSGINNRNYSSSRSSGVRLGHYSNRRVNRHHRYRRHGPLVISNQNGARITSNYDHTNVRYGGNRRIADTTVNGVSVNQNCPTKFNCGSRLYRDDSGPRVIKLGKGEHGANSNVEDIGPPKVITYSNRIK